MECLLEKYLQIKVKGLPNIYGPRTPHILLDSLSSRKTVFEGNSDIERVTALWLKVNLEPCQTSLMESFCEKSQQLKAVTYCYKKLYHRSLTGF